MWKIHARTGGRHELLGQEKVSHKSHEMTAIQKMLKWLDA
jgi:hypothetical protein